MSRSRFLSVTTLLVVLALTFPLVVQAEVVGHLTQVEGRVDLLKGGKVPAIPVKVQDGVEPKDVLRTKSLSKAQITFIDNSTVTVSPESRIAIEDYLFDPAQQKRNAVLKIFQGLAHVVVTKVFKVEEPDFVVKTHTAVMGVRGTDFGVRIHPNSSTILNFQGLIQVANVFPEVGQLFRRAFKVAFSFGSPNAPNSVMLKDMQGTSVGRGMPPTLPFAVTVQDQKQFMNQMGSGLTSKKSSQGSSGGSASGGSSSGSGSGTTSGESGSGSGSSTASTDSGGSGTATGSTTAGGGDSGSTYVSNLGGPDSGLSTMTASSTTTTSSVPVVAPTGLTTGTGNAGVTLINTVTIPPEPGINTIPPTTTATTTTDTTTPPAATTQTYAFTQSTQSTWSDPPALTSVTVNSTGWGLRTGVATSGALPLPDSYGGYFTASGTGERTLMEGAFFSGSTAGVSNTTLTGIVTGVLGSTLTGTGTMTGTSSFGQTINFTGTVTIDSSGVLTFTYGGANGIATVSSAARLASATGTTTYTPGTYFTQTWSGLMSSSSSPPYSVDSNLTNWGGASGSGLSSTHYDVVVTGGPFTENWNYSYLPQTYGSLAGTLQGVVGPSPDGCLQGAATIISSDRDPAFVSKLVTPPSPYLFGRGANDIPIVSTIYIDPADGRVTGRVDATDYQDGRYTSQLYNMTQTPQATPVTPPASATYDFTTTTYKGAVNAPTAATGITSGYGWGYRAGDSSLGNAPLPASYGGYFTSYDQGTWTPTSGSIPSGSSTIATGVTGYGAVTQMSGRVQGVLGQTLTGNMTYIGSLLNGTSFNYTGPVTISAGGTLRFTYTGNWTGSESSGTAAGTLNQNSGYHFTQSVPLTYFLTSSGGPDGTLFFDSSAAGSRSGAYSGTVSNVSGTLLMTSEDGFLSFVSGSSSSDLEGVVGTSQVGASTGVATLTISSPINLSIPGTVSLSPSGSYFNQSNIFAQPGTGSILPSTGVTVQGGMVQSPTWSFSETYQGFRLSTGSAPFTLANIEGYGWGRLSSTGEATLPTNYTGYFVAQDIGTRASTSAMTPGWAGVTGTLTGTLSGTAGSTLTGAATFTGTSSRGASYNFTGTVSLGTDGRLVYNYGGTWTAGANSGTGSGTWTQVMGTYFTEGLTGSYTQTASNSTAQNFLGTQDATPLSGTRIMYPQGSDPTGQSTTASIASGQTSTTNTFSPTSGAITVQMEGVVAGSDWQTKWGVASVTPRTTPTGESATDRPTTTGVVTIDTTGKLTGQFVDVIRNDGGSIDNIARNIVSVTAASGQTTSSFVQTVSGSVTQTPVGTTPSTQATLTTPTALTGTGTGSIPGNISATVNLTSTAVTPTYVTSGTGPINANIVGAVGGLPGQAQTGVASLQATKTIAEQTRQIQQVGTATNTPAAGATPATLAISVQGVNPANLNFPTSGVAATQTGTVTVTPR